MVEHFHQPVLVAEVLAHLVTGSGHPYVDGPVGGGGHAEAICTKLVGGGSLICFDADEDAIRFAGQRLRPFGDRVKFIHANYRDLLSGLRQLGIERIGGLLLDLGVSSFQLDEPERGFSFRSDARLDMRMDRRSALSAWEVVNTYDEEHLSQIISSYGEESHAKRIAKKIVVSRPIETSGQLSRTIVPAAGKYPPAKTLARVFQALRMEVNHELQNLRQVLDDGVTVLVPGGRIVVISYHSLEDRIVKESFRVESASSVRSAHKYIADAPRSPRLVVLTRKPITPTADEVSRNPRALSAKMRVAERPLNA